MAIIKDTRAVLAVPAIGGALYGLLVYFVYELLHGHLTSSPWFEPFGYPRFGLGINSLLPAQKPNPDVHRDAARACVGVAAITGPPA